MLTALEVKTSYSILSSLNRIDKLTEKASELGYFSLAITDTNNMFGVYEFYLSCKRKNIKPIIGMTVVNKQDKFILLAKNNDGYSNLIKISTIISERDIDLDVEKIEVSEKVMNTISDINTNIVGVCEIVDNKINLDSNVIILDGVQDPGNLGTIIRSAVAFNFDSVILSRECVDLYNPKVIRSAEGMMFQVNIVTKDLVKVIKQLKEKGFIIYGTDVIDGINPRKLDKEAKSKFAIVMGNEGNGLSYEVYDACDKFLYIPMNEKTESLNVGVAASIILYEMSCLDE